jgi:alcohol dehydrogenase
MKELAWSKKLDLVLLILKWETLSSFLALLLVVNVMHVKKGCIRIVNRVVGSLAIPSTGRRLVRIPYADNSLYPIPSGSDEEALVMLSGILPTGFECGVLNGQVQPGDKIAIVGAGPGGLAALLTSQFYSPGEIIMVDLDDNRLDVAHRFGATKLVNSGDGKAVEKIMELTGGNGVDVAIEAVGIPATFGICQQIVAAGGHIANAEVHGKSVELHMETLWSHNITLTTRLVDAVTKPMLLKVVQSGKIQPRNLITHRFSLKDVKEAYRVFGNAAKESALKVIINND